MMDEANVQRRGQLEEAVKQAVLDLLAHEHVGLAGFSLPLNDRLSVIVGQTQSTTDSERLNILEQHGISVRPGFSGRAARWIGSFERGGYTNVFAAATVREVLDNASAAAAKPA